ncbi:MAG: aminotransferase class I/II-fold pyridoxal phosphate-dependent enzyme, partial [Planctomycetota bacterium]
MPVKLSTRARKLKPSATFRLARRAAELREQGEDVISFGLGEPDFDTPEAIRKAAHDAIENGQTHYTANEGIAPLRQAIRDAFEKDQGVAYDAKSEVLVTAGAKQAIANALLALVEEGDEVLVPAPYWLTYPEIVGFTGAAFRPVRTDAADGFDLRVEELERVVSDRSRMLLLNSPNN